MTQKKAAFDLLAAVAPQVVEQLQPDFIFRNEVGQRNIYEQMGGLFFAALYATPGTRYTRDPEMLRCAIAAWEVYARDYAREDGQCTLVTFDQDWGPNRDEWGALHWLNTLQLLEGDLPPEMAERWRRLSIAACRHSWDFFRRDWDNGKLPDGLERNQINNHYLWMLCCALRLGKYIGDKAMVAQAIDYLRLIAGRLHSSGCFLEEGSLIVRYAHISFGALMHCLDLAPEADFLREPIRRMAGYLRGVQYAPGLAIGTIDTRNRTQPTSFPLCFCCGQMASDPQIAAHNSATLAQAASEKNLLVRHSTLAFLTTCCLMLPDDAPMAAPVEMPTGDTLIPECCAAVLRRGDWTLSFCADHQRVFGNRFALERGNLVGLHHADAGEIIGGGHSIADPLFSSFEVIKDGQVGYLPQQGELLADGIAWTANGCRCRVTAEFAEGVKLRYSIEGLVDASRARVHLPLFVPVGGPLIVDGVELPLERGHLMQLPAGTTVCLRGARMKLDAPAQLSYPHFPFNSYLIHQPQDWAEAFGLLTVEMDIHTTAVTLEVNK